MRISVERTVRVYDDDHGFFVEAGPDSGGLGLCRIAYSDGDSAKHEIVIPWEMARALAGALDELASHEKELE